MVCVLVAAVTSVGSYLQERARLARLQRMPAAEARVFYEVVRSRQEKRLIAFVVLIVLAAVASGVRLWWKARGG